MPSTASMHVSLRTLTGVLILTSCARTPATRVATAAAPVTTRIVTHVVTHDAKLIGTAVGGVRVTIRDAATGRVLAEGRHEGGTGDTKRIMQDPRKRGDVLFATADGARWEAMLPLTTPTMVVIEAEGPLGYPDQMARASKRMVLVPGRDVGGDGIVLEMNGYVIDVLAPDTTAAIASGSTLSVRARVRMLCSCPTQPGGMWEVTEVRARLLRDGAVVQEALLLYAGEASTYAGALALPAAGPYVLEVVAATPSRASFGVVRRRVRIGG
jgi:hypothetical protein